MNKYVKVLTSALTVMVVATTLVGCSKSSSSSDTAKKESKSITVWSHLNESEVKEIQKIADEWATKTGNTVKVVVDKSDFQAYTAAAQSSKGPDIMFGFPHNDLGVFQKAGLLDEVPSGVIKDSDYASKEVLNAVTWNGKRYAVPEAMETYALFYNTDKIKTAPKTIEELVSQAKANGGFQYDINNFYFTYSWISSFGGYVFKNNNGTLDPKDVGLGNSGAKQAYQWIQDLVQVNKFMKGDIKGDDAKGAFTSGKTAFYLSGPWDVEACQKAGVKFAVAPIPQVNGADAKSFMGVQAAFVSSKSKNKTEAWDLMKALTAKSYDIVYTVGHRIPVLTADLNKDAFKNDTTTAQFAEQAKHAEPMPNIPEMNAVWTPAGNNLTLLTQGKQDAAKTAQLLVDQINQGVAQQK